MDDILAHVVATKKQMQQYQNKKLLAESIKCKPSNYKNKMKRFYIEVFH